MPDSGIPADATGRSDACRLLHRAHLNCTAALIRTASNRLGTGVDINEGR
jgi:hypothetical protein